jgi:hypothetical protein
MIGIRDLIPILFLVYILSSSIISNKPNYRALVIFGFLLGFLRRFLPSDSILATSGINLDPLLLVIPLTFVICLFISQMSVIESKILDWSLKGLVVISTLAIFNPRQGSILVGITGWIAYVIPFMFIYLGSKISKEEFDKILNTLKILGLCVCTYGFSQVILGYNSWDQQWFDYVTLNGEYSVVAYGTNRPFGTFSSIGEYAQGIGMAAGVVSFQYLNSKIKFREFFLYMLMFLTSAALTASRSALIVTFMIALSPLLLRPKLGRSTKVSMPKFITVALLSAWVLPWIVRLIPIEFLGSASSLVERQSAGLGGNSSGVTPASVHLTQTGEAFRESVESIFGFGTGAISGAQRLNGSTRMNFESDIGNASYAFGLIGFMAMLAVFYGLYSAVINSNSSKASLIILILLPSVNNWFNPGHYATVWVMWLLIGSILSKNSQEQRGKA